MARMVLRRPCWAKAVSLSKVMDLRSVGAMRSKTASMCLSFQSAEATFHRCIVPAISLPAHGLNHPRRTENLAVIGGGVLAAAIGMVDQAGRRLLPLDGHGQGCDGQFRPHVVTHRPADDFAGEEIEHDGQIEPPFGGWHAG